MNILELLSKINVPFAFLHIVNLLLLLILKFAVKGKHHQDASRKEKKKKQKTTKIYLEKTN